MSGIVNLYAHITMFCTSRCSFCYQKDIHTDRRYLPLHMLEDALIRWRPQWVVLLGGEPTITAFPGWHGPKLHEYVSLCHRYGAQVAVQTAGTHLKLLPDLHQLVDRITISMDFVSTRQNRQTGRWNNGTVLEDILAYAEARPNVEFTSVYLGENLPDILMIAEWSLQKGRQYLIKVDKGVLARREKESDEEYRLRIEDARRQTMMLFRAIYALHVAYSVDPYSGQVMIEEPSYICYLNEVTGRRVTTYCPAGKHMLALYPDGSISPCPLGGMYYYRYAHISGSVPLFDPLLPFGGREPEGPWCGRCVYHHKYGCNGCPAMGIVARVCPMYREGTPTVVGTGRVLEGQVNGRVMP